MIFNQKFLLRDNRFYLDAEGNSIKKRYFLWHKDVTNIIYPKPQAVVRGRDDF